MDKIPIDAYQFLIFLIPGFVTVWIFRHFTRPKNQKKKVDLEFLLLSFFWGLVVLVIYEWISAEKPERISSLLANPYAAALILSVVGAVLSLGMSQIVNRQLFQKLIKPLFPRRDL